MVISSTPENYFKERQIEPLSDTKYILVGQEGSNSNSSAYPIYPKDNNKFFGFILGLVALVLIGGIIIMASRK